MRKKADYTKQGTVFNIQKFSVNDGPGIRTVVFFKGCPLHCLWCSNPESQLAKPQIMWDAKKCVDCRHCRNLCPADAISIQEEHIHISPSKCNLCSETSDSVQPCKCVEECPGLALELEGEKKTVQEVIDIVMQDEVFYEESGGGITLSGGEFLMQPEFAENLLLAAKEKGLHTCCETTGFAPEEVFERVTEHIDYLLFDLKHYDSAKHKEYTGVANELPLTNMKKAIEHGKKLLPRIPVIPAFNDSLQDAKGFVEKLKYVGAAECQLLPFHQFGENKYHLLDKKYNYDDVPSLHREDLEDFRMIMVKQGINAFF